MVGQLQKLPVATPPATLETVAQFDGAMPTGVTVSHQGRIFVNFPKWGDDVQFTVAELRDGQPVPYPSLEFNQTQPDNLAAALVSVQSVVVDPLDRLWILDTGSPMFEPTKPGGPKLVCVDLSTDRVINTILFPPDVGFQWLNPTYRSAFIATAKAVRTDVNAQTIVPLFQTDPCPLTSDPCYTRGLGWKIPS
jgi:Major royal jelly protein